MPKDWLWRLVSLVESGGKLDSVRLRCAAELGNPTVLHTVQMPTRSAPQDSLTWAETLYMRGELDKARAAFESVEETEAGAKQAQTVGFRARIGRSMPAEYE